MEDQTVRLKLKQDKERHDLNYPTVKSKLIGKPALRAECSPRLERVAAGLTAYVVA